jgi:hypothetical protein
MVTFRQGQMLFLGDGRKPWSFTYAMSLKAAKNSAAGPSDCMTAVGWSPPGGARAAAGMLAASHVAAAAAAAGASLAVAAAAGPAQPETGCNLMQVRKAAMHGQHTCG